MSYTLHAHDETYDPSAGHLSLDFVNTLSWRLRSEPVEFLAGYSELVIWGKIMGLYSEEEADFFLEQAQTHQEEAYAIYTRAIALREALYRMLSTSSSACQPNLADIATLNEELLDAMPHRTIQWTGQGFQWGWENVNDQSEGLLWKVAVSAVDLLTSELVERVGVCQGIGCGWLFLDTSKNHSRRWCDMDGCGNRAKARRHYKRKKDTKD